MEYGLNLVRKLLDLLLGRNHPPGAPPPLHIPRADRFYNPPISHCGFVCFLPTEQGQFHNGFGARVGFIPLWTKKDTLLIRKHFLHVANMKTFLLLIPKNFHACISYMPAHMLGNDLHVRAMKIISNYFLHVANMNFYSY